MRWLATLMKLPHAQVRLLDVAAEALSVEERMGQAVAREALAIAGKDLAFPAQLERELFVSRRSSAMSLRQPDGLKQARGHAAGEGRAAAGKERQSGP